MHDADRRIVSLDDEADLGLRNQHRVCVVQHRVDRMCGSSVVAASIIAEADSVTECDSGSVAAPVAGYGIPLQWLPLDREARPNAEAIASDTSFDPEQMRWVRAAGAEEIERPRRLIALLGGPQLHRFVKTA